MRSLGASSEHSTPYVRSHEQAKTETTSATSQVRPPRKDTNGDAQPQGGTNPMIVREDGESVYLESCVTLPPVCSWTNGEDRRGMLGIARSLNLSQL